MNKIEKFMEGRGKSLKPAKADKDKKDSKKLTKKEIEELTLQMLKDFGYIK